jgi:hypothetical protein
MGVKMAVEFREVVSFTQMWGLTRRPHPASDWNGVQASQVDETRSSDKEFRV